MGRQQLRAAVALIVAVTLLGLYTARWATIDHALIGGSDFSAIYVGGSLWRDGHHADLYSSSLQSKLHARINAPEPASDLPFVNPPVAAVLAVPITLLPLDQGYRVWALLQVGLLVLAVAVAARAAPWSQNAGRLSRLAVAAAAVAGVATIQFMLMGQWNGVSALGLALAYLAWRRGRPALGGAVLAASALAAKPHLALGLAAFLIGWGERRAIVGAVAGSLAALTASFLAVGPAGMSGFVHAVLGDATKWPLRSLVGFTGLFGSWLGDGALAHALAGVGSLLALGACVALGLAFRRRRTLLEPALGGALALSLLASPHLCLHDLVLLAPALVWVMAWAGARDQATAAGRPRSGLWMAGVAGLWALTNIAGGLDLGNSMPAPPGRLIPWTLMMMGGAALLVARAALRSQPRLEPAAQGLATVAAGRPVPAPAP